MILTKTQAVSATNRLINAISDIDLTYAATSVADDYVGQIENSFDNSVNPDEEPWEPIVYRAVPPPPLDVTGALRDSVVADVQSAVVAKDGFETTAIGLVPYAAEQDEGRSGPTRNVGWMRKYGIQLYQKTVTWHPGRPFIGFGDAVLDGAADHGAEVAASQTVEAFK